MKFLTYFLTKSESRTQTTSTWRPIARLEGEVMNASNKIISDERRRKIWRLSVWPFLPNAFIYRKQKDFAKKRAELRAK